MIETISGLGELGTMFASIQTEHIRENTPIDTGMVSSVLQGHIDPYTYLTHWGQDKMAAILQTALSNVFSWMKM